MLGFFNKSENKQKDITVNPPIVNKEADMKNSMAVFAGLESPNYNKALDYEEIVKYGVSHDAILQARREIPIFRFYTNHDLISEELNGASAISINEKNFEESKGFFTTEVCIKLNDKDSGLPQKLWLKDTSKHHFAVYGSDIAKTESKYIFKMTVLLFEKGTEQVYCVYSFNFSQSFYNCTPNYSFKKDATFIGSLFNILSRKGNEFAYDVLAGLNLDRPEVFL